MLPDALAVVDELAKRLEALGIPYFVGGSIASSMHGIFRSTNDVDLVVALRTDQAQTFTIALENDFYVDADMIREAIQHYSSFNVIHLPTMVKADLFLPRVTPFNESQWSRRRLEQIRPTGEMRAVWVASAEDMILQKMEWYRLTGERSDRQWGDVLGMLKVQGEALDFAYLKRWADELSLADLLKNALEDAGLEGAI